MFVLLSVFHTCFSLCLLSAYLFSLFRFPPPSPSPRLPHLSSFSPLLTQSRSVSQSYLDLSLNFFSSFSSLQDTFTMAVSFLSGKVVYISPHGASLMRCKPERLQGALFSELLAPQDVSTFYSSTAPCRLPPWAACIGSGKTPSPADTSTCLHTHQNKMISRSYVLIECVCTSVSSASPPVDCTQEKSMFCRISADRMHGSELRYYPFRLTPYQLTLRESDAADPQPCCLLIAEKVHSGYEGTHTRTDAGIDGHPYTHTHTHT